MLHERNWKFRPCQRERVGAKKATDLDHAEIVAIAPSVRVDEPRELGVSTLRGAEIQSKIGHARAPGAGLCVAITA